MYPNYKESHHEFTFSFLSFVYKNHQWVEDFYDEISVITKLKKKGFLKAIEE